jgi:hypothetical protein
MHCTGGERWDAGRGRGGKIQGLKCMRRDKKGREERGKKKEKKKYENPYKLGYK